MEIASISDSNSFSSFSPYIFHKMNLLWNANKSTSIFRMEINIYAKSTALAVWIEFAHFFRY